ncbi:hypothetical protein Acsp05_25040 [Actinokineospora sp. NBRC 105648]|nr:hypothetical protein Acsp05_25040 [Actinokineospora sp. NBRC 105648]
MRRPAANAVDRDRFVSSKSRRNAVKTTIVTLTRHPVRRDTSDHTVRAVAAPLSDHQHSDRATPR